MWTGNKIKVQVGDEAIEVEQIFVVNADPSTPHKGFNEGWRLHRPCGSPPMDFWDLSNAVNVLFRLGYGRDAVPADDRQVDALKHALQSIATWM